MTDSTIACPQCGTANSIHRLWCQQCGRPVPSQPASPDVNQRLDAERATLYKRLIEDVELVFQSQDVDPDSYEAIKAFSQDQLTQLEERAAQRKQLRALEQLVLRARAAANSGRFHEAIGILQQGLAEDRGNYQLQQMIAEVNEQLQQRETLLQAAREVDALLQESRAHIDAVRLEEAKEKLLQAKQLVPDDKRIITALSEVQAQIAEQEALKVAERIPVVTDGEELPIAEPIAASRQPAMDRAAVTAQQASATQPSSRQPDPLKRRFAEASFAAGEEETPSPTDRLIESASQWSSMIKPFLLDNFGWFVGAFLVVAGFIVLIVTFWGSIEQNRILMHSLVYISLAAATAMFFAAAYFMRLKYPQLENSSNVLLIIVALLIPLLFVAALLTSFVPATPADVAFLNPAG